MKMVFTFIAATALVLAFPVAFAAEQKPLLLAQASAPAPSAPEPSPGEAKSIPMHSRADAIDLTARTFTMKRKDGVEVKHVITQATQIMQGETPAKLEDIKVGDYVSGLRKKVSATEYTVVKITKFGPPTSKQ